jgi:tungstate transport system substrate-binding protein
MADRGTWANFKNRQGLAILVEGDTSLFNPYGSILVDATKRPAAKVAAAKVWHDWLSGPKGQVAIETFRIGGEQVFFPQGRLK